MRSTSSGRTGRRKALLGEPRDDLAGGLPRRQARLVGQEPYVGLGQDRRCGVVGALERDVADHQHALMLVGVDGPEWIGLLRWGGLGLLRGLLFTRLSGFGIGVEERNPERARPALEPDFRLDCLRLPIVRLQLELLDNIAADPNCSPHRFVANLLPEHLGPDRIISLIDVDLPGNLSLTVQEEAATPSLATRTHRRAEAAQPLLRGLGWVADDDGLLDDRLGGRQVFLQKQRRHRQHVADVVEAVTDVVVGEVGGRFEVDANQVADRIVVLDPVEPANRDAAVVARAGAVEVFEHAVDGPRDEVDLGGCRPRPAVILGLGRHLARLEHLHDLFPDVAVLEHRLRVPVLVERDIPFTLAAAVAGVAMLGEKRNDVLAEAGRGGFLGRIDPRSGFLGRQRTQKAEHGRQNRDTERQMT